MKKLLFIINTYNRPNEVSSLLKQIKEQALGFYVTINLYDDGSSVVQSNEIKKAYSALVSDAFKVNYTKFLTPHRKYLYWELVCRNFHHNIRDTTEEFDYYLMLPDDAILKPNYIESAILQWDSIEDNKKICLNTWADHRAGKPCWTKFTPIQKEFNVYNYWLCGWVDMEFICKKDFFRALDYKVNAPHESWWELNPHRSSGVGMYISNTLFKKGFHLYQVTESLTKQVEHKSVMQTI